MKTYLKSISANMEEKREIIRIFIYIAIFAFVAFIFGAAYEEGKMKKVVRYCVEEHESDEAVLNCVYEATYIDPNDWR